MARKPPASAEEDAGIARTKMVLAILLYFAVHIGLQLASNYADALNTVSIWYPAAGLSFAMVIYYGRLGALLVFCAIHFSHALTGDARIPFWAIIPYALGVVGMTLLWRNIFVRVGILRRQLTQTPLWAIGTMGVSALTAASNAVIGILLLYFLHIVRRDAVFTSTIDFFIGDFLGIISVAPFLTQIIFPVLTRWQRGLPYRQWRWKRALAIYLLVGAVGFFLLVQVPVWMQMRIVYLGSVPILISAVRGRVRETCMAIFVLTLFLALAYFYGSIPPKIDLPLFLLLIMAAAYVVTTAISANRSITKSLEATLEERDQMSATQQQLNDQVAHLQSMEALGTLAGGMAHELNNMLQPILTFARAAETATEADRKTYLDRVRDCTLSAKTLVQDVLAFSRSGSSAQNDLLERRAALPLFQSSIAVARRALPGAVQVKEEHALGAQEIDCTPPRLVQVLINLLRNAADAGAKNITLSSCHDPLTEKVSLTIADDGLGMDAETAKRALEPFFTTKQVGRGTGLGLSVVYGIVTRWGGEMRIESISGAGTSIHLSLPAYLPDSY